MDNQKLQLEGDIDESMRAHVLLLGDIGSGIDPSILARFPSIASLLSGGQGRENLNFTTLVEELKTLDQDIQRHKKSAEYGKHFHRVKGSARRAIHRLQLHNLAYVVSDLALAFEQDHRHSDLLERRSDAGRMYHNTKSIIQAYAHISELHRLLAGWQNVYYLHRRLFWTSCLSMKAKMHALFTNTSRYIEAYGFESTGQPVDVVDVRYQTTQPDPSNKSWNKVENIDISFCEGAETAVRTGIEIIAHKSERDIDRLFRNF
ncbi:hypothetical protein HY213_02875 [Candidatus Peregrinibacteria bacterium]|nr:hypothetical protein [Candidatus Peregrinibacteria bacterium]